MGDLVKVKRDGPRGWHWIDASRFDPAVHEVYVEPGEESPVLTPEPAPVRRGRPPKARST